MAKSFIEPVATFITAIILACTTSEATTVSAVANVNFSGSSTLHDFEGTATTRPFTAIFDENGDSGQISIHAKTSIEVEKMTTNHEKRDRNMFKMFDLDHFAQIEGELPETILSEKESTEATLHLKIRNVKHDVAATISEVKRDGTRISCTMKFPVSLKAFELKGPSVLGLIRVDDTVNVECTIEGQIGDKVADN